MQEARQSKCKVARPKDVYVVCIEVGMRVLKKELWPCRIALNLDRSSGHDVVEIETWLGERYGAFKSRWNVIFHWDHAAFYFREEQDATMFALRWL